MANHIPVTDDHHATEMESAIMIGWFRCDCAKRGSSSLELAAFKHCLFRRSKPLARMTPHIPVCRTLGLVA